jgi:hypothetical protein
VSGPPLTGGFKIQGSKFKIPKAVFSEIHKVSFLIKLAAKAKKFLWNFFRQTLNPEP